MSSILTEIVETKALIILYIYIYTYFIHMHVTMAPCPRYRKIWENVSVTISTRQEQNGKTILTPETVSQAIHDEVRDVEVIDVHTHLLLLNSIGMRA